MLDVLIRGGQIIDGTGNVGFYGAVGIEGETVRILRGDVSSIEAARVGKSLESYRLFWMEDPIPAELQPGFSFAGAITNAARQPDAARALLRFLASPQADSTIVKSGLTPIARR